jgi:hypothetical protein
MNISILDGSNYFKGLLLLIRKDQKVTPSEVALMTRIGKSLGFEKDFCDQAIRDILDNAYIVDEPPEFSTPTLAEKFINDGLVLAASDGEIHPLEEEWLIHTASKNGLDLSWFQTVKEKILNASDVLSLLQADELSIRFF